MVRYSILQVFAVAAAIVILVLLPSCAVSVVQIRDSTVTVDVLLDKDVAVDARIRDLEARVGP